MTDQSQSPESGMPGPAGAGPIEPETPQPTGAGPIESETPQPTGAAPTEPETVTQPAWSPAAGGDTYGGSTVSEQPTFAASTSSAADRPEVAVGAAFAGGFVLAMILKRIAR